MPSPIVSIRIFATIYFTIKNLRCLLLLWQVSASSLVYHFWVRTVKIFWCICWAWSLYGAKIQKSLEYLKFNMTLFINIMTSIDPYLESYIFRSSHMKLYKELAATTINTVSPWQLIGPHSLTMEYRYILINSQSSLV